MKAEQISIFLENKEGRIAEVTSILAKKQKGSPLAKPMLLR